MRYLACQLDMHASLQKMSCVKKGLPEGGKARREWASRTVQAAENAAPSMEPQHIDAQDKANLVKAGCPDCTCNL